VSEPSGRDPVEQGAIPWRRLWPSPAVAAPKATPSGACPARRAGDPSASRTNIDDRPIGEAPL